MRYQRLLIPLSTIAFLALAVLPAVVVFSQGWLRLPHRVLLPGQQPPSEGSPEAWALFAVFYLVWMIADVALLVFLYDRFGFKYMPADRKTREARRKARRRTAGLRYMEARERAQAEAAAGRRRRRRPPAQQPTPPDLFADRPPRRPPSERGPQGHRPEAAPTPSPSTSAGEPRQETPPPPAPAGQHGPASDEAPAAPPDDLQESA